MQAKKSYGQHFLKHDSIAARIANSLEMVAETGLVLEVGPGQGMLTKQLLELPGIELHAVEADEDMVLFLKDNYKDWAADNLHAADFLDLNLKDLFQDRQFCLVGNFPYNISTQILFKMLDYKEQVPEMVGMFQKEVADRVVAPPGSKVYGITSVLLQASYQCKHLFNVEPGSFNPPPKVRSAVIRLERKPRFQIDCDEKLFRHIVKTAFNQRRKMLRNTLKPFLPSEELMDDPYFQKRPETLSWEEFVLITQKVSALQADSK